MARTEKKIRMGDNMEQCLYGTYACKKHIVGRCWKHHCDVTVKQLKQKECLRKQCGALEKYEHEYWRQRELNKLRKKSKKEIN